MSVLVTLELIATTCCTETCGVTFGLARNHYQHLRDTKQWFYCPNGHRQHYVEETDADKARRQLREANERHEREMSWERQRAETLKRQVAAEKGKLTKVTNRVKKGVCPFCNRTFEDLARHMATQHDEPEKCEVAHAKEKARREADR